MKTIVENVTNLSKFLFEDDKRVIMKETQIDVGPEEKLDFIVGCHSTSDSTLYEGITGPEEEWYGNKWFFDGATWTLNPDWVDPRVEISE